MFGNLYKSLKRVDHRELTATGQLVRLVLGACSVAGWFYVVYFTKASSIWLTSVLYFIAVGSLIDKFVYDRYSFVAQKKAINSAVNAIKKEIPKSTKTTK